MSAANRLALQQLRDEIYPDLQRQYPELLTTAAEPPPRCDVIDVLEHLEALAYGGRRNPCEFAMDVIGSQVGIIDLERPAWCSPD